MKESASTLELEEIPTILITVDSVVFFLSLFSALYYLFWVNKKHGFNIYCIVFIILYIICSFSSYNIMVMPIHDFNLPIARNFIYHYKVLSILSPLDIISIVSFIGISTLKLCHVRHISKIPEPISVIIRGVILQASFIAILSSVGYYLYSKHADMGATSLKDQMIYGRGVIYFFVLLFLFKRSLPSFTQLNFTQVFTFFCIIDFINFISGLISCFIYYDFLWERYGIKVTIIDQDKIYNYFTIYALLFVSFLFTKPMPRKVYYWGGICIGGVMFFNMYKFLFAIAAIYILYDIFVSMLSGKKFTIKLIITLTIAIISLPATVSLLTSKSMGTRSSQLSDYWEYTGRFFPASLLGIGYGGKYLSPKGIGDKGETKIIDKPADGNVVYKRSIQTPVITQLKNSGIIGVLVMLSVAFYFTVFIFFENSKFSASPFPTAVLFNLLWLVASTCLLLQPYPMPALSFFKLLILFFLLMISNKKLSNN